MLKKILMIVLSCMIGMILISCHQEITQSDEKQGNRHNYALETDAMILIAYFSWSGHTEELAYEIQAQIGGDLFEIQTQEPYTDDINVLSQQSLQEQKENKRPSLSSHVDNMDQYDIVFVGYPNWWSNMPMPVMTFLEEYDFSGKTVIPFTTYGESGFGESIQSINDILKDSQIIEGPSVQEHHLDDLSKTVKASLEKIGFH